jgi:hypothetical protein
VPSRKDRYKSACSKRRTKFTYSLLRTPASMWATPECSPILVSRARRDLEQRTSTGCVDFCVVHRTLAVLSFGFASEFFPGLFEHPLKRRHPQFMNTMERIIGKIVIFQLIFLIIAQFIVLHTSITPLVSKLSQYEGIVKQKLPDVIETIESNY